MALVTDSTHIKDNLFYSSVNNMPVGFSETDKKRLSDALTKFIKEQILPIYRKLAYFLQNEYL